jgi:hypothetical protein
MERVQDLEGEIEELNKEEFKRGRRNNSNLTTKTGSSNNRI